MTEPQASESAAIPEPPKEGLWTVKQVAEYLAVSESYVYELAKLGKIPRVRLGRLYRFEAEEIMRWLKLRKR